MMKTSYPPNGGLDEAYILQKLHNKSRQLKRLTSLVCKHLPLEFEQHVYVLNYDGNQLILGTHEQMLAAKLRYLIPQLKSTLQEKAAFKQLSFIKIKITSPLKVQLDLAQSKQEKECLCTQHTAQLLQEFSDSLDENHEDHALQQALKRLAAHIKYKD